MAAAGMGKTAKPHTGLSPHAHARVRAGEKIAEGFSYPATLRTAVAGKAIEWEERRRLVVGSLKLAERQEKTLKGRLDKAQQAIADLNRREQGRKCLDENELRAAAEAMVDIERCTDNQT
jgi:hypothetical protein